MLTIQHLNVSISDKQILKDFSYTFESDRVYAVMGPNGSGKSTLAYAIAGNPQYQVSADRLQVTTETGNLKPETYDLLDMEPHERADAGVFLSFQSPLALQGVRVSQLMQLGLHGAKSALDIRNEAKAIATELGISPELLNRSLNEGASGGERKKMEVLQAAILDRPIQIYDEVDTGVDVDALKAIGHFLHTHKTGKTYIIITHYHRILQYIAPDKVLVLKEGSILAEGGPELAKEIERDGYGKFLVV